MDQKILNLEKDGTAIPLAEIQKVLSFMTYGSTVRVMFSMLFWTGCRICELDNMKRGNIYDGYIYWKTGKNQNDFRKEKLPKHFLDELQEYWRTNRRLGEKMFGVSSDTFRRYFNRDVRPFLGDVWREERLIFKQGSITRENILQLKGLRKTFQTFVFAQEYWKWKDSKVALEFTSKKMRHSSERMTAYHYLENFDVLGIVNPIGVKPFAEVRQKRLFDFFGS
jgi:integrase